MIKKFIIKINRAVDWILNNLNSSKLTWRDEKKRSKII